MSTICKNPHCTNAVEQEPPKVKRLYCSEKCKQQEQALMHLQANDAWHLRNIEQWLEPAIEYAKQDNRLAVVKAWEHDYPDAELPRLAAKRAIMEQYGIERYPSAHQEREIEVVRAIRHIIEAKMVEQGRQVA